MDKLYTANGSPSGAALIFYKFRKLLSQNRFFGKVESPGQNFHGNTVLEELEF